MGDHFWPSIFPAIAVGMLYGVSLGGISRVLLGGLGALITSVSAFVLFEAALSAEGLLPTLALIGIALAGAYILTAGSLLVRRGRTR